MKALVNRQIFTLAVKMLLFWKIYQILSSDFPSTLTRIARGSRTKIDQVPKRSRAWSLTTLSVSKGAKKEAGSVPRCFALPLPVIAIN